jgi:multidrug transporter EmrE-like cation transporter
LEYLYIAGTILFTVYGQLIIKIRIGNYDQLPAAFWEKVVFLFKLLGDPLILSGLLAAFIASIFWMAAMTKMRLGVAYPFIGLNFVLIFLLSIFLLKEPFSVYRLIGVLMIIAGIFVASRSM